LCLGEYVCLLYAASKISALASYPITYPIQYRFHYLPCTFMQATIEITFFVYNWKKTYSALFVWFWLGFVSKFNAIIGTRADAVGEPSIWNVHPSSIKSVETITRCTSINLPIHYNCLVCKLIWWQLEMCTYYIVLTRLWDLFDKIYVQQKLPNCYCYISREAAVHIYINT